MGVHTLHIGLLLYNCIHRSFSLLRNFLCVSYTGTCFLALMLLNLQVVGCTDDASGRVLCESTACIAIMLSRVAQGLKASRATLATEVVSAPYFPSLLKREQSSFVGEDLFTCPNQSKTDLLRNSLISNQDKVKSSNEESIFGFGTRRRHRCYVVTARARSFLYHQVEKCFIFFKFLACFF